MGVDLPRRDESSEQGERHPGRDRGRAELVERHALGPRRATRLPFQVPNAAEKKADPSPIA